MIILAYSVSSRKTFDDMQYFIDALTRIGRCGVVVAVGVEIYREDPRVVTAEEARAFFEGVELPILYMEASTVTGENVNAILEYGLRHNRGMDQDNEESPRGGKRKKCVIC